jgi:hypothetical protein
MFDGSTGDSRRILATRWRPDSGRLLLHEIDSSARANGA